MTYFLILGVLLSLLFRRNPLSLFHVKFKAAPLIIGCLLIQIALGVLAAIASIQLPIVLIATFIGMLAGMYYNRHLHGTGWISAGAMANLAAIVIHGGLMPVSERAAKIAGMEQLLHTSTTSRHQLMDSPYFWWLGDWIPFITPIGPNFILSLGDLIVGVGLIVFIVRNSAKIESQVKTPL